MKIALTGGATGGHFYPLIAVVEGIEDICAEKKLIEPQYFYFGPEPFDPAVLPEHDIQYIPTGGGRIRKDGKIVASSFFGMAIAVLRTFPKLFSVYPDVVFFDRQLCRIPDALRRSSPAHPRRHLRR
jgi:UDP-N-acetylglucosamine:LPS N-acetylglucosamine transferase